MEIVGDCVGIVGVVLAVEQTGPAGHASLVQGIGVPVHAVSKQGRVGDFTPKCSGYHIYCLSMDNLIIRLAIIQ